MRGYLCLIRKDFVTQYACSCSWYDGKTYFCVVHFSGKLCRFWCKILTACTEFTVFLLFPLCSPLSPSLFLWTEFNVLWIDKVFSINPSANVFFFGDFNVHHKDWLTYSGGTDRLGNSVIIFLSQMTLLRSQGFLPGSLTVILTVLLFRIYLFLLTPVFVLQWLSLHWEILIMLSQFPLTFQLIHNRMPHFIA